MKSTPILLLVVFLSACVNPSLREDSEDLSNLGFVEFRAGVLSVQDDALEAFDIDTTPSVSIGGGTRFGPSGHFSVLYGVDVQWDEGRAALLLPYPPYAIPVEFDVFAVSVPVVFGVNSTSTAAFMDGTPNLFAGVGGVVYSVRASDPIDDSEFGVGPLANISIQIPIPRSPVHFVLDARYSHKPIKDDFWEPIDNIGGLEITAGIGFRF